MHYLMIYARETNVAKCDKNRKNEIVTESQPNQMLQAHKSLIYNAQRLSSRLFADDVLLQDCHLSMRLNALANLHNRQSDLVYHISRRPLLVRRQRDKSTLA